ncbi:MAG: CYTH domain-containing protein [Marinilabiliaceae bacterium]|nr:CYTH domain-containing protein [Marinilabiliaceae bacterium]
MAEKNIEIERKFLVCGEFKHLAYSKNIIMQGYLSSVPSRTVRVRISSNKAYLTIKGLSDITGMKRFEFEKEIDVSDARELLNICEPGVIVKTRYFVNYKGVIVEVDEFENENKGLILAEIELKSVDEQVELPDWIGNEVTSDVRYYNSYLSKNPFIMW